MKSTKSFYFLGCFCLLLLAACVDALEPLAPEAVVVEPETERPYTEYEGVVSMGNDSTIIYLEDSDQSELDAFFDIRWSIDEHIYFVSDKYEFDNGDCVIWGADSCAQFDYEAKEQIVDDKGVTWLYFEPADDFWRCLAAENCDPGDVVFCFHLMVREKGE